MKKYLYLLIALAVLAGCKNRNKGKEAANATPEEIELGVEPTDTLAAKKAAEALPEEPVFDIVTNMGTIRVKLYGTEWTDTLHPQEIATYLVKDGKAAKVNLLEEPME